MALVSTPNQYDHVASIYLPIGLAVFGIVTAVLLFLLFRYRARRKDGEPNRTHEKPAVEISYAVLLALITAFLVTITFRSEGRENDITQAAAAGRTATRVDVIGAQWVWRFTYPGSPPVHVDAPPFKATRLYVPAGEPVLFIGRSQDVVHDFWIPALQFQRQVWPQHTERWGLVFPHPGRYPGLCAWFCGLYHDRMHFVAIALPPKQFHTWLDSQRAKARA